MKTVAKVMWIHEADLIKAKLELYDIDAFIPDEGMSSTLPIMGNTIGGVRVQVADEYYDRAKEILDADMQETDTQESYLTCPSCGGKKIKHSTLSRRLFFVSLLLFGIPLIWVKRSYECLDCTHKWKQVGK